MPEASQTRAYLALLAIMVLWGSYPAMAKLAFRDIYFTTAANAVILSAATPVLVAVVARFYLGERLARIQWAGVAASAFGVILIITNGRLAALRVEELRGGDFINLVSIIFMNLQPVVGLALTATLLSEPITPWQLIGGTFVLAGVALTTVRHGGPSHGN